MIRVGVRELKNRLSRYLAAVKEAGEIVVTERGTPIARISSEPGQPPDLARQREKLSAEGLVTLPSQPLQQGVAPPRSVGGRSISELPKENRRRLATATPAPSSRDPYGNQDQRMSSVCGTNRMRGFDAVHLSSAPLIAGRLREEVVFYC